MTQTFKGKTVLVTGGTRGIGKQTALDFEAAGATVYITGTSTTSFEEFKKSHTKSQIMFFEANFGIEESFSQFLLSLESVNVDVLVNNAGINRINTVDEIKLEDFQQIQKVNTEAPFRICQKVIPHMRKNQWGRIVNISSIFGHVTKEQRLSYTTSKYALTGMTKTLALDTAKSNILVNAVSPGFIDTELTRKVLGEKGIAEMTAQVPVGKLGDVSDISSLVLYLTSESNKFITGQNIIADGGFTCA